MSLYIVGAGGFGRETLDAALECGLEVRGFLDERLAGQERRGLPVYHPSEAEPGARFVVAIADQVVRRRLVGRLEEQGLEPATIVHPRATIAAGTSVGPGCVVFAHAYLSSDVYVGAHVQINYNATIGHDAVLDDYATVFPGGNVSGAVHMEEGATVGANAVVLQGRVVGAGGFVGAGAVVNRDVASRSVVAGVPAKPLVVRLPDATAVEMRMVG